MASRVRATAILARVSQQVARRTFTTAPEYALSFATPLATRSASSPLRAAPMLNQSADMLSKVQKSSASTTHGISAQPQKPKVVGLEDTAIYLAVLENRCTGAEPAMK